VEPAGAAHLARKPITRPNHKIQGAGYMMDLKVDGNLVDEFLTVTDDEAIQIARQLARTEGIFGGFSTGANVAVALRLARDANAGEVLVTTANDSGLKYLSTDLYE
jgi:cysteine synthase A